MGKVKVRRTHREELPGVAVMRDAVVDPFGGGATRPRVLDLDMEIDPILTHLVTHDPDGFFVAEEKGETLGFIAAHVRARQWILSELYVLSQHRGGGAGEALLTRALTYGERSGAKEYLAVVGIDGPIQSLLVRHGMWPLCPVFVMRLPVEAATQLASALSRLLPGQEATNELLARRGQADVDRLDKLGRNITREVDHELWLKRLRLGAAFVRQGARIAAYAYGGKDCVGPVMGASQDSALAGLGWALELALRSSRGEALDVRVPARFTPAVEALLDGGARLHATLMLYGRGTNLAFDRLVLGPPNLP